MRLQGKVACITGAGQAIGRAIALQFALEGAIVLLNDTWHSDTLSHLADEIGTSGQQAGVMDGDIISETAVKRMVESALQAYQHIDIWVNAATAALFDETEGENSGCTDEEHFRRLLNIDVKGTFVCCRAVAPIMQSLGSGCIINMSWDAALVEGAAGMENIIFAAAKGAVHSLSMSLAREYAPAVRVNVIAPGSMNVGAHYPHRAEQKPPLGRFCTPDDVAQAALYLASPEASYITGQTLLVNGGSIMF
jgi:NAD(P)-dependent dehydrogenase (short-subunit alcohol dehydrogenase family)